MSGEWVGYVAAALTTVAFVPQALKTLRSRDTEAWQKGLTDSAEVVELSGMKHVG